MANIYTKNTPQKPMNPKRETISFLLGYSKSIEAIKIRKISFIFHLN